MNYKRLTDKEHTYKKCATCGYKNCQYCDDIYEIRKKAVERLAELEDKIEQGLMLELPCKVGTTLYFIYNKPLISKPILEPKIYETDKWYFDIDEKGIALSTLNPYGYNGKYFYYLGEMVFLTKADAEKKLKELQNER